MFGLYENIIAEGIPLTSTPTTTVIPFIICYPPRLTAVLNAAGPLTHDRPE